MHLKAALGENEKTKKEEIMKVFTSKITLILSLLLFSFSTPYASDYNQKVSLLMEKSGLKSMIDFVPVQIRSEIEQIRITQPDSEEAEFLAKTLFKYVSTETLHQEYEKFLISKLDSSLVDSLLKQTDTPLLSRITQAEVSASDPDSQSDMVKFLTELPSNPPSNERIKIIQLIEEISQTSELMKFMLENIMRGINESLGNDTPPDELERGIEAMKSAVDTQMKGQFIMQFHYVYRDFSDTELNEYIEFMKTTDFQRFMVIAVEGFGHVLVNAFKKGAVDLQKLKGAKSA